MRRMTHCSNRCLRAHFSSVWSDEIWFRILIPSSVGGEFSLCFGGHLVLCLCRVSAMSNQEYTEEQRAAAVSRGIGG